MALLVDTYNVLHTTGVLPPDLAGLGVFELRDLILTSRFRHMPVVLVCDGLGPGVHGPDESSTVIDAGVTIHYAGTHRDADTHIERAVRACTDPHRLNVVSSDRRIVRAARRRRCRVTSSGVFLESLESDWRRAGRKASVPVQAYSIPLDPGSIGWWREYFGLDPRMADAEPMVSEAPRRPHVEEPPRAKNDARARATEPPSHRTLPLGAMSDSDEVDIDSLDTGQFL